MSTLSKPACSWAKENSAMYSGSMPDGISSAGLMPPPNRLTVTPREESRSRLTPIIPMTSMLDILFSPAFCNWDHCYVVMASPGVRGFPLSRELPMAWGPHTSMEFYFDRSSARISPPPSGHFNCS